MYLFAQQVTVTTSANAIRLRQGSADLLDDIQRHIDGEVDEGWWRITRVVRAFERDVHCATSASHDDGERSVLTKLSLASSIPPARRTGSFLHNTCPRCYTVPFYFRDTNVQPLDCDIRKEPEKWLVVGVHALMPYSHFG